MAENQVTWNTQYTWKIRGKDKVFTLRDAMVALVVFLGVSVVLATLGHYVPGLGGFFLDLVSIGFFVVFCLITFALISEAKRVEEKAE